MQTIPLEEPLVCPARPRFPHGCASHWLSVVTHLDPRYGGISSAVPLLAHHVATCGRFRTSLAVFCDQQEMTAATEDAGMSVSRFPMNRLEWLLRSRHRKDLEALIHSAAGLHLHGIWEQSSLVAARCARARGVPYVVSAHGMLERWALANKRGRKLLYAALAGRPMLNRAACLLALTGAEAEDYRKFGLRRPIAVVPNGVEVPARISPALFLAAYPELLGKRIVLFLGRIHYKKGLELLVRAWQKLGRESVDAHLVLAGPDSEGTQALVTRQIAAMGIAHRVLFTGMLNAEMKWSALAAAECFVLPSYSEGFSISVLEAMAASLPVVITDACNMPEVASEEAGFVIPVDASRLEHALRCILSNSRIANADIGARGHRLVRRRYDWAEIGLRMSEIYTWVQGGPLPTSVEIMPA